MKRSFIIFLLFLSFNFLFAQQYDGDAIKRNIIALGRKIEQIATLAERYKNNRAQKLITEAWSEFTKAQELLNEWQTQRPRALEKLIAARAHYKLANKLADQAARQILFKPTANLKTQLERLIHQAESIAHQNDSSELRYFLNKAREFHRKALNAFSQSRYLKGHEYLKIATYFAEKTISLAKSNQGGNNRAQKFDELKNNIQVLLNQAFRQINDDPILNELYQSAQNFLKRALTAFNNGNLKRAYAQLQIAERLVYRIIDLSDNAGVSTESHIKDDYQSLGRYISSVRNEFEAENKKSNLLDKAENIYIKAGNDISAGKFEKAAVNLKLSQRMAMRAFKKISSGSRHDSENLQSRINETQHLISLQGERLNESPNNATTSLYNQAMKFFNQAQQAYENQQFVEASYMLNLCLRILKRNEKLFKNKQENRISKTEIESDLLRIEQIFSRLGQNPSLKDKQKVKLNFLNELLLKARSEFEKGNLVVTHELLGIIQQQLSTMLKN